MHLWVLRPVYPWSLFWATVLVIVLVSDLSKCGNSEIWHALVDVFLLIVNMTLQNLNRGSPSGLYYIQLQMAEDLMKVDIC